MARCSNCDTTVPLRKSLDGRPLEKQDRTCPECGQDITPDTVSQGRGILTK